MPSSDLKWEMGSNLSVGIGLTGMDELRARWLALNEGVQVRVIPIVLRAGAEVMKSALEAATPVGKSVYIYYRNGKTIRIKSKRPIGQAKANVIIYARKAARGLLTQSAEEQSLLIGYEKKKAYYMYWYEYGSQKQAAHPFARAAFDGATESALAAMDAAHNSAMALEDTA